MKIGEVQMSRSEGRLHLRLTWNERIQHLILLLAVLLLAISGLALRFHDSFIGRLLIGLEGGIEGRGLIHRLAALILIGLCIYHFLYVVFSERGHRQLMEILPRQGDWKKFFAGIRHSLNPTRLPPAYGRFTLYQKFQYFAVMIGCLLMTLTGFLLWFETPTMEVFPKWVIDLTRVVHSWEGVLIFIILIVWHLYQVHLSPGTFPMNKAWLNGMISEERIKRDHPLEYDKLAGGDR
jgi:cytochrome b subunit of formate dehydrogenase